MLSGSSKNQGKIYQPIPGDVEEIAKKILDAAYMVHTALGAGLIESVYETCLGYELSIMGVAFQAQAELPVVYKDITVGSGLRLDLLVEKCVIVEIKAVENIIPVHKAQLLTYLKLSGVRLGFLINFNVPRLKDGITRFVI